jgi:hypothetical protein
MKHKITVELEQPKDFPYLLEVVDITEDADSLESCPVSGLCDCSVLEVGSWLRKSELKRGGIQGKNSHVKFIIH